MPTGYTVRVATPTDEARVTALLQASYPALMEGSYDAARLSAALPMMTRAMPDLLASGTYYVAESGDGQIVGCGGWTRERPSGGEAVDELAHVRHFATHPDWVRRGIGRAILDRCLADAREAGVRRFECQASLNAEDFYRALGFATVRRMELAMGRDVTFPALLMARTI